MAEVASGRVSCEVGRRHGAIPASVFGDIVSVIA